MQKTRKKARKNGTSLTPAQLQALDASYALRMASEMGMPLDEWMDLQGRCSALNAR